MATLIDSYPESQKNDSSSLYTGSTMNGQSFMATGGVLNSCKFYLRKLGSPNENLYAKLYAHTGTYGSGGKATGSPLATSDPVNATTVSAGWSLVTFTFSGDQKYALTNGTAYCIVANYSFGNSSAGFEIGVDGDTPTHSGSGFYYSTEWNSSSADRCFYVYKDDPPPSLSGFLSLNSKFW